MVRNPILALGALAAAASLAACAASPLYVPRGAFQSGGEIPRDGRGEPIWDAIRSAPPPPVAPNIPPAPGIPITGPGVAEMTGPPPPVGPAYVPVVERSPRQLKAEARARRHACRLYRAC